MQTCKPPKKKGLINSRKKCKKSKKTSNFFNPNYTSNKYNTKGKKRKIKKKR